MIEYEEVLLASTILTSSYRVTCKNVMFGLKILETTDILFYLFCTFKYVSHNFKIDLILVVRLHIDLSALYLLTVFFFQIFTKPDKNI